VPQRTWIFALSLSLVLMAATTGCSKSDGAPAPVPDAGPTDVVELIPPDVPLGDPCLSSDECLGEVCDKRNGACVECYLTAHCDDAFVCVGMQCAGEEECIDDSECTQGVCGPDETCLGCNNSGDCTGGWMCVESVCRPLYPTCDEFKDCEALGAVCLEETGRCADCTDKSQCGDYEWCSDNACAPEYCTPGDASCVGDAIQLCRADGKGFWQLACDEGQTCFGGACIESDCTPGESECVGYQVRQCLPNGTYLVTECAGGHECLDNACQPLRHRVLVIFDTSGSMAWFPGTNEAPKLCGSEPDDQCIQPWPTCQDPDNPLTTMAISKSVFSDFFAETENALFSLNRFPQRPIAPSAVCEGGYNDWANTITDDDGAMSVPLFEHTWFDENLGEINVVPFPPTGSYSNVDELLEWVDFTEWLVETDVPCTDYKDCDNGVCLGLTPTNKKCQAFANPELRATGWTPLGKSLFYAGEYMRRSVVVDGKPCSEDADCGSPGYYCSAGGSCFDPFRDCRLNVIVLFTDGVETEYPIPTQYFNPILQAKRLRLGLGCEVDEDCSDLDTCHKDPENPGEFGCYPTSCHEEGYCTNELIETDAAGALDVTLDLPEDRLRDYNGNGIEIIVHVVDASISSIEASEATLNNNRLISLYGGGEHIVVDVDDPPDFLAKLKQTVDFKQVLTECAATPVTGGPDE
jgi:hypothetical protein